MRRRPKPWGLDLWDKVEVFLQHVENYADAGEEDSEVAPLGKEAHELRKLMVAENARRAEMGE